MNPSPRVALAHDYLSVRGGAERAVVSMAGQFPDAALYTSFLLPDQYPELAGRRIVTSPLDRIRPLARRYRAALPVLPLVWDRFRVDSADVVICSTSGWAHGIVSDAPKIAYCHNPARWLYQADDYTATSPWHRAVLGPLSPWLRRWDQRAAASCARYVVNSTAVARRVEQVYRRDVTVVWPPTSFDPTGPVEPIDGIDAGFVLCVSRLLGYKNVAEVIDAARLVPGTRWVVVGDGPLRDDLARDLPSNVVLAGAVDDRRLRWAYRNCAGLVSASFEDFGLTPVEAALCGAPSALLRHGGFLDTCIEGVNGVFFESPTPASIAAGVRDLLATSWDRSAIVATTDRFSEERFGQRLRAVIDDVIGDVIGDVGGAAR